MPLTPTYSAGTVAVSAGSAIVTGTDTLFVPGEVRAGDVFERDGLSITILTVDTNDQVTLVKPWPGTTGSGNYEIRYTPDASRVIANTRQAITLFEQVKEPPFFPFIGREQAEQTSIPANIGVVNVAGKTYSRSPDGGGFTSLDGGRWRREGVPFADVTDFGGSSRPDPDGTETDATGFIDALAWLKMRGGGILYVPHGTYRVGHDASAWRSIIDLSYSEKLHVRGDGPEASVLICAAGHNGQGILMRQSRWCSVSGLTIDGNKSGQSSGFHGIRMSDCEHIDIGHCYIKDPASYGITYNPGGSASVARHIRMHHLTFEGSVADAIDGKNTISRNTNISVDNVTVLSFSTGGPTSDANLDKAAIDVRGPAKVTNCTVYGVSGQNTGIRMRFGEANDGSHGYGGHECVISNFHIYGSKDTVADGNTSMGVNVGGRNVKVSNGIIEGCRTGVNVNAENCVVSGVTSIDAAQFGFRTVEATRSGRRASFSSCTAINPAQNGFLSACEDVHFTDCRTFGGVDGFWIEGHRNVLTACEGQSASNRDLNIRGTSIASGCRDIGGTWSAVNNSGQAIIVGQVIRA